MIWHLHMGGILSNFIFLIQSFKVPATYVTLSYYHSKTLQYDNEKSPM